MNIQVSILSTLTYHDIFDYPLTLEEISTFLNCKSSQKQLKKALQTRNLNVESIKNYYFLKNRGNIVKTRMHRKKLSIEKFKRANFYKNVLKLIPSVKLIGITGSLAVENSTKKDDIDLLVITSKNSIWTTRLFANLLLWPWKRSPTSPHQSNKACLNIFIDETDLKIKDENLYTAHELAQMRIIYDKENTYVSFVQANLWLRKFLPNWENRHVSETIQKKEKSNIKAHSISVSKSLLSCMEKIFKQFQLKYMKSKKTTEQIGDTQLFFHPKDTQSNILKIYQKKIRSIKY